VEGQALLAAARKYKRVVQVGTQRRSTPHLVHARDRIIREGKLGTVGFVEIYCYYPMRPGKDQPDTAPPAALDYEMWTGPAPMRPYNPQVHPRGWRAFMEYGNGVVGDMCIHMLDAVRWLLDLGMPTRVSSSGGILIDTGRRSNISDTQTATFDFPSLKVEWTHRTWGAPPDPKYTWGMTLYGDKGTLKASVYSWDFVPLGGGPAIREDVKYELDEFPEDRTEKDLERHVAPAIRYHMKDLLSCIASRGRPVADIEEGYKSTAACILANVSMQAGRSITWDHAAGRAVGDDEVNRLLRRPYRAPWVHPEVATV
jgi:predicted dehydrogenase